MGRPHLPRERLGVEVRPAGAGKLGWAVVLLGPFRGAKSDPTAAWRPAGTSKPGPHDAQLSLSCSPPSLPSPPSLARLQITNWWFAAAPGHPALRYLLDKVAEQAGHRLYTDSHLDTIARTGPGVFTEAVLVGAHNHPPAKVRELHHCITRGGWLQGEHEWLSWRGWWPLPVDCNSWKMRRGGAGKASFSTAGVRGAKAAPRWVLQNPRMKGAAQPPSPSQVPLAVLPCRSGTALRCGCCRGLVEAGTWPASSPRRPPSSPTSSPAPGGRPSFPVQCTSPEERGHLAWAGHCPVGQLFQARPSSVLALASFTACTLASGRAGNLSTHTCAGRTSRATWGAALLRGELGPPSRHRTGQQLTAPRLASPLLLSSQRAPDLRRAPRVSHSRCRFSPKHFEPPPHELLPTSVLFNPPFTLLHHMRGEGDTFGGVDVSYQVWSSLVLQFSATKCRLLPRG